MELRVREVAKLFAVSEKKIYQWIEEEGLPSHQISGQHWFNRAELLEWATAHQIPLSNEIFDDQNKISEQHPSLADALQAGGIFHEVGVTDRESALQAIVKNLPLPDDVDRDFLREMLLAREMLASTGIGEGIAIPHMRNPTVLQVSRPLVSLCLLDTPIEFGAVDDKPVYALFSLISPTVQTHLHMLSRLAFALRDTNFNAAVKRLASAEEILKEARRAEIEIKPPVVKTRRWWQR